MFERLGQKVLAGLGLDGFEESRISSEGIGAIGDYFKTYSLSRIFPYESFDVGSGLYINRSTVGFVFESSPLVGCTDNIHTQLAGLFQYILPEGSNIQFLLMADPYIGEELAKWGAPRHNQSPLFSALAKKRQAYLSGLVTNPVKNMTLRTFRCFISVTIPLKNTDPDGAKHPESVFMRSFLKNVGEVKEQINETFRSVHMSLKEVSPAGLMVVLDDLVHPRFKTQNLFHSKLDWNPHQPICEQIPTGSHSLTVKRDGLYVNEGEHIFRFYGVKRYPRQWSQGLMGNLVGDPFDDTLRIGCPFFLHYGVHIPAQGKLKLKFMTKANHVERQAGSQFARFIPEIEQEARENQFVREQLASNHRFVQTNLTVGILSDPNTLNQNDQAITNLFRANNWEIEQNRYLHMQSLANIMPMSWGDEAIVDLQNTRKLKRTLSSESANILPIQGEWYGSNSPDMLFVGRRGQLLAWSPFDNKESNYNVSIVGQSGSGKSAFMQEFLTGILGRGARAFVIDIGRSFQNTCHLLGGEFIEFRNEDPICLNPFSDINEDDASEFSEALRFVKAIVRTMAEASGAVEESILEKAIQEAWAQKKTEATITDVADILKNSRDRIARNLGTALYTYTNKGLNGSFFEGKSDITFRNQLTVFELEELKENRSLQNVVMQMVILIITNQIYYGDRKTPFVIMFDEAWQVMSGEQGAKFIEDLARRLRKYKSALITGTQNLSDFYKSDAANAAYQNSAWTCILSQSETSIHEVTGDPVPGKASLNITAYEKKMLLSLHTRQGQYSEVMIRGPHGFAVARLRLDPFSRVLYSTQADEFSKVKEYVAQGKTMAQAIEMVTEQQFGAEMAWQSAGERGDGFASQELDEAGKEVSHGLEKAS